MLALVGLMACDDPCPAGTERQVVVDADGRQRWCATPEGVEHGPWQRLDPQGRPIQVGRKHLGTRVGPWTWYQPASGEVRQRGRYDQQGRPTGRWSTWHSGGQLEASGLYRQGQKTGLWERYDSTGHRLERAWWTGGEGTGRVERFHSDGALAASGRLVDGLREGVWQEWAWDGALERRGGYRAGEPDGEHTTWHGDGTRASRGAFEAGVPIGRWTYWHPNGQLAQEGELRAGRRWGRWQHWTPAGTALPDRVDVVVQDGTGWGEASEMPEGGWVYAGQGAPTDPTVRDGRVRIGFGPRSFLLDADGAALTMAQAPLALSPAAPVVNGERSVHAVVNGDALVIEPKRAYLLQLPGGRAEPGMGMVGDTLVYADDTGLRGVSDDAWWRTSLKGGIDVLAAGEGTVVVGLDTKDVVGLDVEGKERWRRPVFGRLVAPPIVAGGLAVVATDEPALRGLDLGTGEVRWALPVAGLARATWIARSGQHLVW